MLIHRALGITVALLLGLTPFGAHLAAAPRTVLYEHFTSPN
jgi:hypothetical protein